MALTVERLGMSLIKMGRSTESVRFLDDVDLTFSLDSRSSASRQMTSIEISCRPIVFRASYRDINLITSIVNVAIDRYGQSQERLLSQKQGGEDLMDKVDTPGGDGPVSQRAVSQSQARSVGNARVSMSKEQV